MAFDYCTVVGKFRYSDGTVAPGTVSFTPVYPLSDGTTTVSEPVVFTVNGSGDIPADSQVPLVGAAGTSPQYALYQITKTSGSTVTTSNVRLSRGDVLLDLGVSEFRKAMESPAAAIDEHEAATNPHPVYMTQAESDARYATDAELTTGLGEKSDVGHTQAISSVIDLVDELAAKSPTSHTHSAYATTAALTSGLAGKAATDHTHAGLLAGTAGTVADAAAAPTMEEYNVLLAALRTRGVIA